MSIIAEYMHSMDKWERAAFFPYLFAPILLSMLLMSFLLVENGIIPIIFLSPIVILGFYTFYQIGVRKFATDSTHFLVSGGIILYTIFFPYLLSKTDISTTGFTVIYLLLLLPTFLGHVYSIIYQITSNMANEQKSLIIKE